MSENLSTSYGEYETRAVRDALDAITMGIVSVTFSVEKGDSEYVLPPDDDAAAGRLQKLLDALNSIYPAELVNQLFEEVCGL